LGRLIGSPIPRTPSRSGTKKGPLSPQRRPLYIADSPVSPSSTPQRDHQILFANCVRARANLWRPTVRCCRLVTMNCRTSARYSAVMTNLELVANLKALKPYSVLLLDLVKQNRPSHLDLPFELGSLRSQIYRLLFYLEETFRKPQLSDQDQLGL
jgi:hypothetical protein